MLQTDARVPAPSLPTSSTLLPEVHAWAMERPALIAAGLTRGMTVVDLGCGRGTMTRFVSGEVGSEGKIIGVDVDEDALAQAKTATAGRVRVPIAWESASAYDTGLADASVDMVIARNLFQQLTDPARALAEIARILKPGGRVCMIDAQDSLLWIQPEPAGHADFMARAAAQQRMRGGDRDLPRKLAALLFAAHFQDVRTDVHVFDTQRMATDLFVELAISPVLAAFPGDDAATVQGHVDACRQTLQTPHAHGSAGFYATFAQRA